MRPLRAADLPWLIATVFDGGVCGPVPLMLGLAETQAATAPPPLNLESVFALAIAWLVFHEFVVALRELDAARTVAYFSIAPLVGAAVAIVGFGEPVTNTVLIAAVLMAAGVARSAWRSAQPSSHPCAAGAQPSALSRHPSSASARMTPAVAGRSRLLRCAIGAKGNA